MPIFHYPEHNPRWEKFYLSAFRSPSALVTELRIISHEAGLPVHGYDDLQILLAQEQAAAALIDALFAGYDVPPGTGSAYTERGTQDFPPEAMPPRGTIRFSDDSNWNSGSMSSGEDQS